MELYEANKILRAVKTALNVDGRKIPSSAETDGLMMLLGKLDADKYLLPKIKHARALAPSSAAYDKIFNTVVFFRALMAVRSGIADPITSMSVMMLHRALFGDLDKDAGKPRAKEVMTDGSAHTDAKYIAGSLKSILAKMNEIGSAPELGKEDFAGYLSHYMRELIILHPFERGSEFTVRIFCMLFAKLKGFGLGYNRTTPSSIKSAEMTAFAADDVAPLYTMLRSCLFYETKTVDTRTRTMRTRRERLQSMPRSSRLDRPERAEGTIRPTITAQPKKQTDDDVLKRAVRLQQKIAKLNDQLTELMQPFETADED